MNQLNDKVIAAGIGVLVVILSLAFFVARDLPDISDTVEEKPQTRLVRSGDKIYIIPKIHTGMYRFYGPGTFSVPAGGWCLQYPKSALNATMEDQGEFVVLTPVNNPLTVPISLGKTDCTSYRTIELDERAMVRYRKAQPYNNGEGSIVYPRGYTREHRFVTVNWIKYKRIVSHGRIEFLAREPGACLQWRSGINHKRVNTPRGARGGVIFRVKPGAKELSIYIRQIYRYEPGCK